MKVFIFSFLLVSQVLADSSYEVESKAYYTSYAQLLRDMTVLSAEARLKGLACEDGAYSSQIGFKAVQALRAAATAADDLSVYNQIKQSFISNKPVMDVVSKMFSYRFTLFQYERPTMNYLEQQKAALVGTKFYSSGEGAYGSTFQVEIINETKALVSKAEFLEVDPWVQWKSYEVAIQISVVNYNLLIKIENETYKTRVNPYVEDGFMLVPSATPENVDNPSNSLYESPAECEA